MSLLDEIKGTLGIDQSTIDKGKALVETGKGYVNQGKEMLDAAMPEERDLCLSATSGGAGGSHNCANEALKRLSNFLGVDLSMLTSTLDKQMSLLNGIVGGLDSKVNSLESFVWKSDIVVSHLVELLEEALSNPPKSYENLALVSAECATFLMTYNSSSLADSALSFMSSNISAIGGKLGLFTQKSKQEMANTEDATKEKIAYYIDALERVEITCNRLLLESGGKQRVKALFSSDVSIYPDPNCIHTIIAFLEGLQDDVEADIRDIDVANRLLNGYDAKTSEAMNGLNGGKTIISDYTNKGIGEYICGRKDKLIEKVKGKTA